MSAQPLRAGIAGYGLAGRYFHAPFLRAAGFDVVGATTRNPERIAHLDMILLRLGVCELLYFDTIPTKVTINEYIDLAKEYSTEQSGHFVNGILDNIHKELVAQNKLHKISFKKAS